MTAHLNKEQVSILNDRILFPDGDSVASLEFFYKQILDGESFDNLFVSKKDFKSEEVKNYNKKYNNHLTYKTDCRELDTSWNLPEQYKDIDLRSHVAKHLKNEFKHNDFSDEEKEKRIYRVKMEFRIIEERQLEDLIRCMIYIVDTFKENNIVWGTGRGSSCACYILYLLGVHQVDSVYYDLDVSEFFR